MTAHFHTAAMRLFYVLCDTWTVFLTAREVRSVFISIYRVTHDSGS